SATQLKEKWSAKGVLFGSLDELVRSNSELVRKHLFTRAVDPNYDKFSVLHAACWSGGHLLYLPRGLVFDEPVPCLSVITNGGCRCGGYADRAGGRRRGDDHVRDGQRLTDRWWLPLRRDGSHPRADVTAPLGELAKLGAQRLALCPSEGDCRPRCGNSMDDR